MPAGPSPPHTWKQPPAVTPFAVESFDRSAGVTSFGMGSSVQNGDPRFTHSGGLDSYSSFSVIFPADRSSVVVLCNFPGNGLSNFVLGLAHQEHHARALAEACAIYVSQTIFVPARASIDFLLEGWHFQLARRRAVRSTSSRRSRCGRSKRCVSGPGVSCSSATSRKWLRSIYANN